MIREVDAICLAVGFALILIVGCGDLTDYPHVALSDANSTAKSKPLYVDTDHLWPGDYITVCWLETQAWSADYRELVRYAVETSWSWYADIDFVGWEQCISPTWLYDIVIKIEDTKPHTVALGTQISGVYAGMVLNFAFYNWNTDCQGNEEMCIRNIAIHEFGHALGFAHEHNRDDTPASCTEAPQGPDGTETYGAWDAFSIMNYCNPWYVHAPSLLSSTDVAGVQHYYGVNPMYTVAIAMAATSIL